jgi:DNA polymerase III subunit chi
MTRVDFYVSSDDGARAAPLLACRLAEKAWKLGHKVYVHAPDPAAAQQLDELMWTFRDVSFVPHSLTDDAPVRIGHGGPPEGFNELLVNLASDVPPFAERFDRVAEIVAGVAEAEQRARARFKHYRDRGHEPETHQV